MKLSEKHKQCKLWCTLTYQQFLVCKLKNNHTIIMEYLGEANTSFTVHGLFHENNSLEKKDWVKTSYNVADALNHVHKKSFLHCDLKSNNVIVFKKEGFLIDFGKTSPMTSPPAKKYKFSYSHIAPEVLKGSPCSIQSDVYTHLEFLDM